MVSICPGNFVCLLLIMLGSYRFKRDVNYPILDRKAKNVKSVTYFRSYLVRDRSNAFLLDNYMYGRTTSKNSKTSRGLREIIHSIAFSIELFIIL